jgi:ABC-type phosphate transport system substrate-binding protein
LAGKGSVVMVTGSSAAKPYLQQIARQLAEQSIYLVYASTGSCVGVDAIVNATPVRTGPAPAPASSATYWDSASSTGKACDVPAPGVIADIGVSDVFAQTCPGLELSNLDSQQVRDAHGPIQTMGFAVPANSTLTEISARAAYLVFGLGNEGGVLGPDGTSPIWNDERYIFQRSESSGTQALLAAAIGVPSASFRGKPHKSSDEVANDLLSAGAAQTTANQAIGILAADYIDTQSLRAQIRVLAYQDTHQTCAMYPDSTAGARDKQNVRDGHYPLWGPLHLLYKVDGSGAPANAAVRQQIQDIVGYLTGSKALPNGVRLIDVYAQSGLVPECAMRVSRTNDGGNLVPFAPANPCSCLYDAVATGATDCTPCALRGDCKPFETCSFGYCEK